MSACLFVCQTRIVPIEVTFCLLMLSNDKLVILSKWRKTSVENIERGRVAIINRKDVNEIVHCQLKLPITIDGRRDVVEDSCYQPSNSSGVARATRRNAF